MRKTMILAVVLTMMGAATARSQGIVVNKADGTKVYFNAEEVVSITTFGYDESGPHAPASAVAVDLGLPSGTKWANMNVGANAPEDYGDYFAWGETRTKDVYDWSTYTYCDGSVETCLDIGSDIAGDNRYDAATANWGSPWQMPTKEQLEELKNNCTADWTQQNGVYGQKLTGPNGRTIFIPAAGNRWESGLDSAGSYGDYWSSTPDVSTMGGTYYLDFGSGFVYVSSYYFLRGYGLSVRPVCKN